MLKRITRNTLLIACLLLAGAWAWSVLRSTARSDEHAMWGIELSQGILKFGKLIPSNALGGTFNFTFGYEPLDAPLYQRLGFIMPKSEAIPVNPQWNATFYNIAIPLWTLLTPLLPITTWLWYPIIRNRLHGKRGTGFPVELKQPQPVKE